MSRKANRIRRNKRFELRRAETPRAGPVKVIHADGTVTWEKAKTWKELKRINNKKPKKI
jgi:hypothetical protein